MIRKLLQFIDWQRDARPYEQAPKELHAAVNEARALPDETKAPTTDHAAAVVGESAPRASTT